MPLSSVMDLRTKHQTPTSFRGKRVLVLGHAREGASVARYLSVEGADVTATDRKIQEAPSAYRTVFGPESPDLLRGIDVVVTSPGVPENNVLLAGARELGIAITNPTQIFFDRCPCQIAGVTGSSGKSTTTSILAAILESAGRDVLLGGNIGNPMLDLLQRATPDSVAVLELSSFQLELLRSSPQLAVMTNIGPNHLDRHGNMDRYIEAKSHIISHQKSSDIAVLNADDAVVGELVSTTRGRVVWFSRSSPVDAGAYLEDDMVVAVGDGDSMAVLPATDLPLRGAHNLENALAAVAASSALGAGAGAMRAGVMGFKGLPHRLQPVGSYGGVTFIDDSIATSPERAAVALHATLGPIILIAGGRSKNLPWDPLIGAMAGKVRGVILIGEAGDEIADAITVTFGAGLRVDRASSMSDAVCRSRRLAHPGDTVLLAPACTSYDMFADFEERGDTFRMAVEEDDGSNR